MGMVPKVVQIIVSNWLKNVLEGVRIMNTAEFFKAVT